MIRRSERLLLDTHVLLWFVGGQQKHRLRRIRPEVEAAQASGRLHVSAYTGWEVGMLWTARRLELAVPPDVWFRQVVTQPGIRVLDVTPDIAMDAALLPDTPPGDPADRILMATARQRGLTLVTADRRIADYGVRGYLDVTVVG